MPVPLDQLLLFLVGSILVTIVPGPDMALVMRQVLIGGTALAQRTIFGNMTGIVVHAVALAVGLSALLVASSEAYTAVKLAGAVYLVYLGVQTLRSARSGAPTQAEGDAAARPVPSMRTAYLQGLISTVLNPKPALLFLTYVPQFVDASRAVLPQIMSRRTSGRPATKPSATPRGACSGRGSRTPRAMRTPLPSSTTCSSPCATSHGTGLQRTASTPLRSARGSRALSLATA